jgi:hypothetical protein
VRDRPRRLGFDPGINVVREIDQTAFWRVQDALPAAAKDAGVPSVWFDDVWSAGLKGLLLGLEFGAAGSDLHMACLATDV